MTPVNGAIIVNLGTVDFKAITDLTSYSYPYSTTPIPGNDDSTNQLVNGDVFVVHTNSGNFAKVKVLEYGYNIYIEWNTFTPPTTCAPEFPSIFLPAILIIGFLGAVLLIQRTRGY